MQKNNDRVQFSKEVSDFIKSHNAIGHHSMKYDNELVMYWDTCKYIETEHPNIFEVIYEESILDEFVENRKRMKDEAKNN